MTPFDEDSFVCEVAARTGMEISRIEGIRVTDEPALKRQGLMRQTPDYPKIRRLMNEGIPVFGVERGDFEYIFRRPKGASHGTKNSDDIKEKLLATNPPV